MKNRRLMLGGLVAAGSASVLAQAAKTAPMQPVAVPKSEAATPKAEIMLTFQSAFPAGSVIDLMATRYAQFINECGGNRLHVTMLPVNAVAPTNQIIDAVNDGRLDGTFDFAPYWYAKNNAIGLWGSSPTFGMNGHLVAAWHYQGGGRELLDEVYKAMGVNVISFPCVALHTQPLGWFNKPVLTVADLSGLRYRIGGLSGEVMKELGVIPTSIPGGEIAEALQAKKIDAAEWNDVSSDRAINLHRNESVCMVQSFHESATLLEVLISGKRWATLPDFAKSILENAAHMLSEQGYLEIIHMNALDYEKSAHEGVRFLKTPKSVLQAQLNAWDRVIERKSADPLFAKVVQSQREFAKRVVRWKQAADVDFRVAYLHYAKTQGI